MFRRFALVATLLLVLVTTAPGLASASSGNLMTPASIGSGIVQRFWDGAMKMVTERLQSQVPFVTQFLEGAETLLLRDEDFTTHPAIRDVYGGMRLAGILLLAFCTVISLVELTESNIMGNGATLASWFKRFFVATLMTFGSLQFYSIWIRLFGVLLTLFRHYLDTHYSAAPPSGLYGMVVKGLAYSTVPVVLIPMICMTLVVLIVLWFVVGGVRKAEMMISVIIAPLVWPVYLIPSLDDIPKTAFRSFLGLNATLLIVVGMLRLATRLAFGYGAIVHIWDLVPALSVLMMTVFLPTIIKRIVGQGHSGTTALVTAAQVAASLKFLAMGVPAAGAAPAAAAPAAGSTGGVPPTPPGGGGFAPLSAPAGGGALPGGQSPIYRQARVQAALGAGAARGRPFMLDSPPQASGSVIDMAESTPGSGHFDIIQAIDQFEKGRRQHYDPKIHEQHRRSLRDRDSDDGGEA